VATTAYQVRIGDRLLRVQLRRAADVVFVRVDDGDEVRADLRSLHGALYSLTVGEQRHELAALIDDGDARVVLQGLEYAAEVVDEARARLAAVSGQAHAHAYVELKAPMPGLLVRLLCSVGDEVAAGQPLAVLQAMKMENELSLARGGRVTDVRVQAGQTVEQGQVLVVVE
jgi:biotin carboxyl carrier protein